MKSSKDKYTWIYEIGKTYEVPGAFWQSGVFKLDINKNDIIIIEGSIRIISNFIIMSIIFCAKYILFYFSNRIFLLH